MIQPKIIQLIQFEGDLLALDDSGKIWKLDMMWYKDKMLPRVSWIAQTDWSLPK